MVKKFTYLVLSILCLTACEPFNLARKEFPVCQKPSATIGYTTTRLQAEFFLENKQGDIGVIGWDLGNGVTRTGERFSYLYDKPGSYDVTITIKNQCNDSFTTTRKISVQN